MMSKRVLVIVGHPSTDSFCAALADSYVETAIGAGQDVRVLYLGDLCFDPVLHEGYNRIQPLEPDLIGEHHVAKR